MTTTFLAGGVPLRLRTNSARLQHTADRLLAHIGLQRAPAREDAVVTLSLSLTDALTASAPGAPIERSFGDLRLHTNQSQVWLAGEHLLVDIDLEAGRATGTLMPDCLDLTSTSGRQLTYALYLSTLFLARHARSFMVHAAGLTNGTDGVLLIAPPDAGKSTLAYNLVRHGWHYLSDDTILLSDSGNKIDAYGLRQRFGLDLVSRTIFAELDPVMQAVPEDEEKLFFSLDDLHPDQAARQCTPTVLIFPKIVDQPASSLLPISKMEALEHTMQQSALLTLLDAEMSSDHLNVLSRLVNQTRHFRLLGGRDLVERPESLLDVLAPALQAGL